MPVKVECESCKAPYTIDERRIPASGLRVRCPKCTKTFVVKKPSDGAPATDGTAAAKPPAPKPAAASTDAVGGGESRAKLPATPPTEPDPSLPPSAQRPASSDASADLPAPVATGGGADLPAPRRRPAVLKGTQLGLGGLVPGAVTKAGVQARPPIAPPADVDLPSPTAAKPPIPKPAPKPIAPAFDDLPAARAERESPAPNAPAQGAVASSTKLEFGEIDLPAVGGTALPAARPQADLPAPRIATLKIAPPPARGIGDVDLPAVGASDLPSPRAAGTLKIAPPPPMEFGEIDLPAVGNPNDLPSPRVATQKFGEIDLPAVTGAPLPAPRADFDLPAPAGAGLPAPAGAPLPAPAGPQLPAIAAHLPAIGGPGLPSPREPSVAFEADPFTRDMAVAQTMLGPGYQPSPPAGSGNGFGEIELPGPSLSPATPADDPWGAPPGDLDLRSGTAKGFGEIDLGPNPADVLGTSPRAATGVGASAVDVPGLETSLGSPAASPGFGSDFGELELPGPGSAPLGASPNASTFDGGGQGGLSLESFRPPPSAPVGTEASVMGAFDSRTSNAGGMGFGEVDLGGGDGGEIDDMEFGAIPQEKRGDATTDLGGFEAPLPKPRGYADEAPQAAPEAEKKKSNAGKWVAAALALLLVGGATLQFDDNLGAFGWKAISDKVNAEKHANLTSSAVNRTREAFGEDAQDRAEAALQQLAQDISSAPRYVPLAAYAAYAQFAYELRFGKDPQRDTLAKAALAKITVELPAKRLATAARDVVSGQLDPARATLKSLLASDPKDVDAAVTLGELELLAKKPKDAIAAFEQAIAARDDLRTRSGLIRALDAAGETEKAKKEATELAEKAPKHVASRLLLAKYAWEKDRDEKLALKWITELESAPVSAGAAIPERVAWMTLRGMIALDRGRVTDAKTAFESAIQAANGSPAPHPQYGLGEVHMANGMYPAAISAFQTAAQAAPDMTIAKIGVARAFLKQEKASDAKATLAPLKDPELAGEIGFWLGQAEEKINPDKPSEAIKIYEEAIKAQPGEPKPYIALASLQAKIGKPDEADATLEQASKNVPPSERLHLGVGELRFRQERYAAALEQFEKALELQPANLEALFFKGRCLLRMAEREKWEAGKAVLDEVEKKDPHYPGLTLEFGLYYQQTQQLEKALEKYKAALDAAPNDVDIKLMVARAQVEARMKEAEENLRDVLSNCSNSPSPDNCTVEAKHFLGRALLNKGASSEARKYLQDAVDKGDNNAQYHLYLGWALLDDEVLADAERELNRALELDKSLAIAYWLRAEILGRNGKHKEAIEQARQALAYNPARHEAHATIAFSLKHLNQEEGALQEYALAVKGDPMNRKAPWWRYQIADIWYHRNATARALPDIREAIKVAKTWDKKPGWLPKAYFFLGEGLRRVDKAGAIEAYQEYLRTSIGLTDPARKEAMAALAELGSPWGGK